MKPIRVAIVDDSKIFRKSLRSLLERHGDLSIIAEGETGLDAMDAMDIADSMPLVWSVSQSGGGVCRP